ncbi:MAG: ribokinase [Opitutae bacterium]|nr:ribokinase [Opitutae bacterium]
MNPSVVVVGSFIQDLAFFTRDFPRPGETVVGDFRAGPGGKGFNQAVAATRAGAKTLFIGAVGSDAFGAGAHKFARAAGVQAHFVDKKKEATGAAVVSIDAHGQNQIIVSLGANLALHKRDVPVPPLRTAAVVVCQGESDFRTVAHVLRTARATGAVTVLNPAPMRADFDPALLKHTEVLIPNETEFVTLANQLPRSSGGRNLTPEALLRMPADRLHTLCRSFGVPVVIVTLGAQGCFVSEPGVYVRIHAHEVEAVDATGAGDAFVGGFAAGLVRFKRNVFEAAHFATAVAALAVTLPGTATAMPTAREITRFLKKRDHA